MSKKCPLEYHSSGRKGKIEVISTKPCQTAADLSLAYSPGVAEPCLAIQQNPEDAYKYTAKGNLVAVVSNGTAVLGLGNLGALAGKPVMEGKGVLFKRFADIDVFDIELDTEDPEEIIRTCQLLEPTFGGINLEDIKAPECFYIEETLKKTMKIPVFHDDQHGTAIISSAALINALDMVGKKMEDIRIVVNGAGAAANSCAKLAIALGVKPNNMIMCDTKGVIYKGRVEGMNPYKELFAADTPFRTLEEAANRGRRPVRPLGQGGLYLRNGAPAWLPIRSSSPWPIPIRKSPRKMPTPCATTSSWPPAAPIIRTRSTTSSAFPSSSAGHWTFAPAASTRR